MQQLILYKYSHVSFRFYDLYLIHCLPKVGLHSHIKKIHQIKNKVFTFKFIEDILFFICSYRKTNFYLRIGGRHHTGSFLVVTQVFYLPVFHKLKFQITVKSRQNRPPLGPVQMVGLAGWSD